MISFPVPTFNWVDGLDRRTTPQQNATPAQLEKEESDEADGASSELIDYPENLGGPGRTRTYNQQFPSQ